ncbi:alpha/beta hydrolase [Thalassobellus citreus]|uniref:alpha/beta hydrolase n=1 Tax=Thalassobellus citreus TaxID=3367752 RepID=UPI0037A919A9
MRNIIIYILCLFALTSQAQKIEIGEVKTIQSKALKEEREYLVYLPEHYSDEKYKDQHYPVIYLLDGEKYFHVTSGILKNLSNGYYPQMPECILIAIKNTERSRDLTPTHVSSLPYKSGGADTFQAFISQELIPEINSNYRVLDYKILVGHSFGGLFALNTLFKKPKSFNAYVAIDPSLWWDNKVLVKELDGVIKTTNFKGNTLFLASANSIKNQKNPSKQHYVHFEAKKEALKLMEITAPKNLNYHVESYENEDHGSVVLPSLIDAFRSVFSGFRIDVKALIKNPSLLQKQYENLSNSLGYDFKPQCAYLDKVVDLSLKRGQKENAEILHNFNKTLYPNNVYLENKLK